MTTINAPLLRQTLEQIETHPETWHQRSYRCGTGMCFAGWASELDGGEWLAGPAGSQADLLLATQADGKSAFFVWSGAFVVGVYPRARRILGLTDDQADDLFNGRNDRPVLRRMVAELLAQTHHVTIVSVPEGERDARLAIVEHRPYQPTVRHTSERWIPREDLEEQARRVADAVGAPYVTPMDPTAYALLNPVNPAELVEEATS